MTRRRKIPPSRGTGSRDVSSHAPQTARSVRSQVDDANLSVSLKNHENQSQPRRAAYVVGDMVLAHAAGRRAQLATIVELDYSDKARFKIAFEGKRKKPLWTKIDNLVSCSGRAVSITASPDPSTTSVSSTDTSMFAGDRGGVHKARAAHTTAVDKAGKQLQRNQDPPGVSSEKPVPQTFPGNSRLQEPSVSGNCSLTARRLRTCDGLKRTLDGDCVEGAATSRPMAVTMGHDDRGVGDHAVPLSTLRSDTRAQAQAKAMATSLMAEFTLTSEIAVEKNHLNKRKGLLRDETMADAPPTHAKQRGCDVPRAGRGLDDKPCAPCHSRDSSESRPRRAASEAARIAISNGSRSSTRAKASQQSTGGAKTKESAAKTKRTVPVVRENPRTSRTGWKRPRIVTPATLEGRTELALRAVHPTTAVKVPKKFKTQTLRAALKKCAGDPDTNREIFRITSSAATSRTIALRGPLRQPTHSLLDLERTPVGNAGKAPQSVDGSATSLRRGDRVRKTRLNLKTDVFGIEGDEDELCDDVDSRSDDTCGNDAPRGRATKNGPPPRFCKNADTPWGERDVPRVKVVLRLSGTRGPLSAERSSLSIVSFLGDRHHHSGEQLANVLTAENYLCFNGGNQKVFVLTDTTDASQRRALKNVENVAQARCGVGVKVQPWLSGRAALDEFLDHHRLVLRHILRHRLAMAMWSEIDGVYYNALFCGPRPSRVFNGVRLSVNVAVSSKSDLETGLWELWITVEPAVHLFSPVNWRKLMEEKEAKGLAKFAGYKTSDVERRLKVVCLPNCSSGVVYDVQEEAFEMDCLQKANLARGYLVGPRSEDEMVEYWRQVHHINLPSTNFIFVKVQIGGMVLTYPSWCVIRGKKDLPEATDARSGRILNFFTDALDSMDGVTVQATTFPWKMLDENGESFVDAPAFVTGNGTVVEGKMKPAHASRSYCVDAIRSVPVEPSSALLSDISIPVVGNPNRKEQADVSARDIDSEVTGHSAGCGRDAGQEASQDQATSTQITANSVSPKHSSSASSSLESRAAEKAARTAVVAARKSIIQRRGMAPPRLLPMDPEQDASRGSGDSTCRLCATPFVVKRQPSASVAGSSSKEGALSLNRSRPAVPSSGSVGRRGYETQKGPTACQAAKACESSDQEPVREAKSSQKRPVEGLVDVTPPGARAALTPAPAPAAGPSELTIIFSRAGSLGLGLSEGDHETGTVAIQSISPTSAAASVPIGWCITKVDGKRVRGLGAEKIASLLGRRPLEVVFEPPSSDGPKSGSKGNSSKDAPPNSAKAQAAAPAKHVAPKKKKSKSKKAAKIATARRTFNVQPRAHGGQESGPVVTSHPGTTPDLMSAPSADSAVI